MIAGMTFRLQLMTARAPSHLGWREYAHDVLSPIPLLLLEQKQES
jgi:hypothetical protein